MLEAQLRVHNPLFSFGKLRRSKLMGLFYWSVDQNDGNAIKRYAPSGPQKYITKASYGLHNNSKLLTMVITIYERYYNSRHYNSLQNTHTAHNFKYISLALFFTTATWNFQKLPIYTFYGGNVVCLLLAFFHSCSFSRWWPLAFFIFSPSLAAIKMFFFNEIGLLCFLSLALALLSTSM